MADPIEAGTPQATPTGSESAGTVGQVGADGSESTGKPVDPALAMAWKAKAEKFNDVEGENRDLRARLAAAQQYQYGQVQPNPMAEMVTELQQNAQFDVNARASLATLTLQATQAAENKLTREMVRHRVPEQSWDIVEGLVRQSGYQMPVEAAIQLARGREVPDLAKQLAAERERSAALQKALDGRTVGGGASPNGNPATTTPAAVGGEESPLVTMEEYQKLPKELRDKARIQR